MLWLRLIDDICAICTLGRDILFHIFGHMNTIQPKIKFEMSQSWDRIPFLDTLIIPSNKG